MDINPENLLVPFLGYIKKKDRVAVFNTKNELIGLGIARGDSKELLTENEGVAIRNDVNLLKLK